MSLRDDGPLERPRSGRVGAILYWAALLLTIAGITHLVAVLVAPRHSPADAYARLARIARGVTMTAFRGPSATDPLPGLDPALASTFCLFDLRQGPIQVTLDVADAAFAAISVYSRHGQVLYGLTNRSASEGRLSIAIMTTAQAAALPKAEDATALAKVRIETGETTGIVLAQALATAPSAMPEAQAEAGRLACRLAAAQAPAAGEG